MRRLIALVLVALAAASIVGYAAYEELAGWIGVRGVIKVEKGVQMNPRSIEISLNITSSKGEASYKNIAVLKVPGKEARILFKVFDRKIGSSVSLALGGTVILKGPREYRIPMPCMLYTGSCIRIMSIIPGYDAPLSVEEGSYNVSLTIDWMKAEGEGPISFKIGVLDLSGEEATLEPLSTCWSQSINTTGWMTAENSTRSYALLVEKTDVKAGSSGYGSLKALAWIFAPKDTGTKLLNLTLLKLTGGKEEKVAELNIPVDWCHNYYQALILIKAKPGTYILRVSVEGIPTLNTPKIIIHI